jgi:HSP20 family protein
MSRLMQRIWDDIDSIGPEIGWTPLVDIEETDDAWIVEAEVPGVRREDVDIEVQDRDLVISGEVRETERKGILRRRGRRTGRFYLRLSLPGEVVAGKVDAKLKRGVLRVRVPKARATNGKRIEVAED